MLIIFFAKLSIKFINRKNSLYKIQIVNSKGKSNTVYLTKLIN